MASKKDLHTFVGRANFVAGLMITLRPFLHAIWAALYTNEGGSPANTVWKKQIEHSLSWLRAFVQDNHVGCRRYFSLQEYLGGEDLVEFGTDASPWDLDATWPSLGN